jgi:shikimate dehydrogenase
MDTKLFPIIGCPMTQSSASYAYNPLFEGNDIDEIMWPVEIRPGRLPEFMAAARTLGIRHFALTMPHKSAIIPLLDEVNPESRLFNSVNIVKVDENGRTIGVGMDGKGNMAAIERAGVDVRGMRVCILGAGSIVGVILLELARRGAKKVTLVNRSLENAEKLRQTVNRNSDMEVDMEIECFNFENNFLDMTAESCDFFMQATPLGLKGFGKDHEYLGFIDKLPAHAVVMENIVNPPRTALARRVEERGLKLIYGVDMMLGQIGEIFEFCYGKKPNDASMKAAQESVYEYFKLTNK